MILHSWGKLGSACRWRTELELNSELSSRVGWDCPAGKHLRFGALLLAVVKRPPGMGLDSLRRKAVCPGALFRGYSGGSVGVVTGAAAVGGCHDQPLQVS